MVSRSSPILASSLVLVLVLFACGPAMAQQATACKAPVALNEADVKAAEKSGSGDAKAFEHLDIFSMALTVPEEPRARNQAIVWAKLVLGRLQYPIDWSTSRLPSEDPAFCAALMEAERNAGLTADGILTMAELERLQELAQQANERSLGLPMKWVQRFGDDYVRATGTWVIQGEQIAFPVNFSEIICVRAGSSCWDVAVSLSGSTLVSMVEGLDILRWTADEVEAGVETTCRRMRLTINTVTQQVYQTVTDKNTKGCGLIEGKPVLAPLGKPRVSTLENGFDVSFKYFQARRAEAEKAMPSAFQKALESLGK